MVDGASGLSLLASRCTGVPAAIAWAAALAEALARAAWTLAPKAWSGPFTPA
jgi:hypothetical protein